MTTYRSTRHNMVNPTLKEIILEVAEKGVKATELIAESMQAMQTAGIDFTNLMPTIDELVANGDLIEIEYSLPSMPYRIKSFYFPKGTIINLQPHNLAKKMQN